MIKTRLIKLLSHAKKYIVFQVMWKWLALLTQVVIVFTIAGLLDGAISGKISGQRLLSGAAVMLTAILMRFFCDRQAVQKFAKKLLRNYWGIYTELGDSFLENLQG